MVVRTVLSLLRSGVRADTALKTINSVMLMKDDGDSFATLDLVIADQRSGRAKFYKIGAAPTLLRRKAHIEEMKLSAVPLGIVNGLKVRYMEATLRRGDRIILMSDGVSDGGADRSLVGDISGDSCKDKIRQSPGHERPDTGSGGGQLRPQGTRRPDGGSGETAVTYRRFLSNKHLPPRVSVVQYQYADR